MRYYDPSIGRWMSCDPMEQGFSPYVYCGNNPLLFIDPTGENWFYYNDAWNWHKGDTYTYKDDEGKETKMTSNYTTLVEYKITGKNLYGAVKGSMTVYGSGYDDVKASASGVFSGGGWWTNMGLENYDPIESGNYLLSMSDRDADGPGWNDKKSTAAPHWGIQFIPDGSVLRNTRKDGVSYSYNVNADWGNGRMRILNTTDDLKVDWHAKDRGLYIHGKDQWWNFRTHGCVCDKSEVIFNYYWSGGGKNIRGLVPFHVLRK